jgi:hypothetical protein
VHPNPFSSKLRTSPFGSALLRSIDIQSQAMITGPNVPALIGSATNSQIITGLAWTEFATDSPLEESGFEPSVPLLRKALLGIANRDVRVSGSTSR